MPCGFFPGGVLCRPEPTQSAMCWEETIDILSDAHTFKHTHDPFEYIYVECCRKPRWAARVLVVPGGGWYDPVYYCAPGHGCRAKFPPHYGPR